MSKGQKGEHKMNKKLIGLVCLGMLTTSVSVGTALNASATVIPGPNGITQIIDNADGSSTDSANITVTGQVGFDNTNPNPTDPGDPTQPWNPSDPNQWLNIEVPTSMAFYSTDASNYKTIEGDAGMLKNNSGRPVGVGVTKFDDGAGNAANLTGIATLTLTATGKDGQTIDLKNFVASDLIQLDSNDFGNTNLDADQTSDLKIAGTVDAAVPGEHKSNNTLELKFTPLDNDGNSLLTNP